MKRAATAAILLAGSLLLAGCGELPQNLEGFLDWRQKFFLHIDPNLIENLLGPILGILIVLAVCLSLFGLMSNLKNERPVFSGGFATGIAIFGAIAMLYLYIPLATALGETLLPPDLTIDKVFSALHWDLTASLGEIVTVGWGVTFTLLLPLISALWQVVMLVAAVIAIFVSIGGRSLKGVFFALFQIVGWAMFLALYNTLVTLIGEYYPTWEFSLVEALVTAFYTGAAMLLMLGCYIGVPWLAASLAPSREEPSIIAETKRSEKLDWERILTVPLPIPHDEEQDETVENNRSADYGEGHSNENGSPRPLLPSSSSGGSSESEPTGVSGPSNHVPPENSESNKGKGGFRSFDDGPGNKDDASEKSMDDDRLFDQAPIQKRKSHTTLETVDKVARAVGVAGTVTGKPEVVIGAKAVELTTRIIKDAREAEEPKEVVKGHLKGLAERAIKSKYPSLDDDRLFGSEKEAGSED